MDLCYIWFATALWRLSSTQNAFPTGQLSIDAREALCATLYDACCTPGGAEGGSALGDACKANTYN